MKRAGNFNKLMIVRISKDWSFEDQITDRRDLPKGDGKWIRVKWRS